MQHLKFSLVRGGFKKAISSFNHANLIDLLDLKKKHEETLEELEKT